MSGFDWPGLLRLGMRALGLKPQEFWALTPAELTLMLGRDGAAVTLDRARLEELAAAFPDAPQDEGETPNG
ncbi:rcc01693 family protein [Maritimibacter sp. UBA3975]|uniref:rcc01693 family protein n=1 Tax=Maritimibacter sp. UBA3975 TaxID=1946833 RepID=UPI000C0B735F|nr:rcc01693 family protein [Maritimibacter sp. UBA3975]MAM61061.1 hypothetical protein [Maritimibacter sp.]|tara:strand:- start:3819 stop:4031 length:213 start_codon:yes stop_codon:yes gene_type:complete